MRRILFLISLILFCAVEARAQNGVRVPITVTQRGTVGVTTNVVTIPQGATINFCNAPANAVPCTNKATTYTDATLGTPCATNLQIVLDGTNTCVATPDAQGNAGVWVAAGQYAYTITLPGGINQGPYFVTAGGSGGSGGSPGGGDTQVQVNHPAGNFAGDPSLTFNSSTKNLSANSFNSTIYLNSLAYPCTSAGITSAIAALPASGGVVDGSGCSSSMTWSSNVLTAVTVPVLLKLGPASITLTANQNIPTNMDIECVKTTNNSLGTQFTGTLNTGAWFTFQDATNVTMNGCGFVKTGTAGGDLFDVIGSKFIHLTNFPNVNGNWANLLVLDTDAGSSVLYNEFSDWFGVAGFTGNGIFLKSSNVSKTDNSNRFTNLVLPQVANSTCIMFDSGALSTIGENRFFGGDCNAGSATGSAGINVNTSFARDNTFWGITVESEAGTGYRVVANASNTECIGCQISGNGTNVSDAGSNSIIISNVGGVTPSRFWDQFGNIGVNTITVGTAPSGCSASVTAPGMCTTEGAHSSFGPHAGTDYFAFDPTVHGPVCSYNNSAETNCDPLLANDLGGTPQLPTVVSVVHAPAHTIAAPLLCLDSSGSGVAQSCTTTPTFTPAAGDTIIYKTTTTNTGSLTINVNSSSAVTAKKWQGSANLASGDLVAGIYMIATYDGTNWEFYTIGNAPSGGGSGTVNNCTTVGGWAYYAATGTTVSCLPFSVASLTALQGTDTKVLTAGTVAGTGATLCTDANGGATTSGCTSGGSPGAPVGAPQQDASGSFGAWGRTIIVDGTNVTVIPATPAATTRYLVTGDITQASAITVSNNNVTVECSPGSKITRSTATDLFDVTGNNFTLKNCLMDGGSQSTAGTGPLVTFGNSSTAANDGLVTGNTFQNTGTSGAFQGTILVQNGQHNKVDLNIYAGTQADYCVSVFPIAAKSVVDTIISRNFVAGFNPGANSVNCVWAQDSNGSGATISGLRVEKNTIYGQGSNAFLVQIQGTSIGQTSASPRNLNVAENNLFFTGSVDAGFKLFSFFNSRFHDNVIDDQNFANQDLVLLGDTYNSSFTGNTLRAQASSSAPWLSTDEQGNTTANNQIFGVPGATPGFEWVEQSGPLSNNNVTANTVQLTSAVADTCFQMLASTTSFNSDGNIFSSNNCIGTGTAGQKGLEIKIGVATGASNILNTNILGNVFLNLPIGVNVTAIAQTGAGPATIRTINIGNNSFETVTTDIQIAPTASSGGGATNVSGVAIDGNNVRTATTFFSCTPGTANSATATQIGTNFLDNVTTKLSDTCTGTLPYGSPIVLNVTSDFITAANTNLQLITGLSFTFPANVANTAKIDCDLSYNQQTAAAADAFGIQDVTVAPTEIDATGFIQTAATTWVDSVMTPLTTTTATNIVAMTPSAITTVWHAQLHALVQHPNNASSSVLQIMAKTGTSGDTLTVKRGSSCSVILQ